jgi:small subunit ribosomal protein S7
MSRGHIKTKKHDLSPDAKYDSILVSKFINYIMLNGKKTVAERIAYNALEKSAEQLKSQPMDVFSQALKNVGPILEVKSKRIGGANYQVPVEVNKDRKNTLAMRWLLDAARSQKGKGMAEKLAFELVNAYHGEGSAIKKKQDTHKMAEANKAFAHFARF